MGATGLETPLNPGPLPGGEGAIIFPPLPLGEGRGEGHGNTETANTLAIDSNDRRPGRTARSRRPTGRPMIGKGDD